MTNLAELAHQIGLEQEDFIELVKLFLKTSLKDISKIKDGLEREDRTLIKETAHAIKGAAGSLGFNLICDISLLMEKKADSEDFREIESLSKELEREVKTIKDAL